MHGREATGRERSSWTSGCPGVPAARNRCGAPPGLVAHAPQAEDAACGRSGARHRSANPSTSDARTAPGPRAARLRPSPILIRHTPRPACPRTAAGRSCLRRRHPGSASSRRSRPFQPRPSIVSTATARNRDVQNAPTMSDIRWHCERSHTGGPADLVSARSSSRRVTAESDEQQRWRYGRLSLRSSPKGLAMTPISMPLRTAANREPTANLA